MLMTYQLLPDEFNIYVSKESGGWVAKVYGETADVSSWASTPSGAVRGLSGSLISALLPQEKLPHEE